jgi:uncharacterized SAM-binding protein YcdF (DUF218 family)
MFAAAAAGLLVALFVGLGQRLVVQDTLRRAQAIVVLSGRMPIRAIEAARLYRQGYAPQIWLTHPKEPSASLAAIGITAPGEDFYNFQILQKEGVPADAIRVLDTPIDNTADEIRVISSAIAGSSASPKGLPSGREPDPASVIIVTSKAHTRRVHVLWRKFSGGRYRAIIRAAAADPFDPGHWWRNTGDALDVVREVLGLLNAYAGLPLRPANSP